MLFHADSYFTIGAAHATAGRPCQDYADVHNGVACRVVVSDGCSTGGRTDIGSRIVALSALRRTPLSAAFDQVRPDLLSTKYHLGLNQEDLLATCLMVTATTQQGWFDVSGDGVTAMRRRDGTISMTRFEWANNMPYYPAYYYDETQGAEFIRRQGGFDAACFTAETVNEDGSVATKSFTATQGERLRSEFNLSDVEFAAVFSDGVTQIDGVDWKDAVRELLAFKNTNGDFVKRRSMAAIRKWREVGKGPIDDFSMAVIRIDHDDPTDNFEPPTVRNEVI